MRISRIPRYRQRQILRQGAILLFAALVLIFGRNVSRHPGQDDPFPPSIEGRGHPIDGDSLRVGGDEVRLKGIDAPEGRQTCRRDGTPWNCGDAARDTLRQLIGGDTVVCSVSERDRFGRLLANCRAGSRELNAGMVAAGMAVSYGGFRSEEAQAKAARKGLWGAEFQMPRAWRDEHQKNSGS
ncbi:nuclease [Hyphomicrobium methylovorum]|uniref:thermonuclease family protein n=1 Tax=Hyphomicrobium methylovorum TaxID=84 RepID=UPI0015E68774|nr:thermonuclease family protein [Hyphomicrobium methylovorum]MBA2124878.1 nuclease [Hyphomicrobium methylovorum]